MMSHLFGESQLAFQQRTTSSRIDYPVGRDLTLSFSMEDVQTMELTVGVQINLLDFTAIQQANASLRQQRTQSILQATTVKLVRA